MLLQFRCGRCGAVLAARRDWAGQSMPCSVCRAPVEVPAAAGAPQPPSPHASALRAADDGLALHIAQQAEDDARRLALAEARAVTAGHRRSGIALILAGGLALCAGAVLVFWGEWFWVPRSMAYAPLGFGTLSLMIGIAVWRLACETAQEEFRRRMPGLADRLRMQYWSARRGGSQAQPARLPATRLWPPVGPP